MLKAAINNRRRPKKILDHSARNIDHWAKMCLPITGTDPTTEGQFRTKEYFLRFEAR